MKNCFVTVPVVGLLSLLCVLPGCQPEAPPPPEVKAEVLPKDEVLLSADSSKRAMIVEMKVELMSAPVMEPVAGKIAYDETRTVRISAPISGRIVSGIPMLGAAVKAKAPLIELDSPEFGQAKEVYANALADERLADSAWARAKTLYDHGVLPHKQLQEVENQLEHAKDDVRRSLMHLKNLGVSDNEINNRYLVRSPIAGLITERHVNSGMEVRPDLQEPLFVVSDLQSLWLLMSVFEKDLGTLKPGTEVVVHVPAFPDRPFTATVEYVDKLVDEATRTIKVRARIANLDGALLPAMYATAEVQDSATNQAIVVPLTAVFTEGEGDQVFVKIGDGHYKQRDITIRLRLKDRAVISTGLLPGETIVSEGALLLRTEEANEQTAGDGPSVNH